MLLHESIVERILYKVVKRHIAGTTISSAIEKAKELNSRGVPVSLAFLSSEIDGLPKARYVANTYAELAHRIARFGLKASMQVPLEEIGYAISVESSLAYLHKITQLSSNLGIFTWVELPDRIKGMVKLQGKGVGYAVSAANLERVKGLCGNTIKLMFQNNALGHGAEAEAEAKAHSSEARGDIYYDDKYDFEEELETVQRALESASSVVLQAAPEKLISTLLKNSAYKKSLIFEFQLGYAKKLLLRVKKKGWRVSMYVPFGKGWVNYAVTRIQGRYTRIIARRLLDGKKV
ncbi:MAG: hypothetical protein QXT43_02310 [Candidatus Micrarchaeaceae archaeon]